MSAAASGLEEPPTVENWVDEGADQPLRREPQVRVLWRVSLGLKRSGDSGSSGAGVGEDVVHTGLPLQQSRQVGLLWIRVLWILFGRPILGRVVVSLGSQPAKGNEKWWGSTAKGGYADPPSWPGWSHY